jgi:hypothetical protein
VTTCTGTPASKLVVSMKPVLGFETKRPRRNSRCERRAVA